MTQKYDPFDPAARAGVPAIDRAALQAKLDARVRWMRRMPRLFAWIYIVLGGLVVLGLVRHDPATVVASIATLVLALVLTGLKRRRLARHIAQLAAAPDVVAAYRADLEKRIEVLHRLPLLYAFLIAISASQVVDKLERALDDDTRRAWADFGFRAGFVVVVAFTGLSLMRDRRKLERERATLG